MLATLLTVTLTACGGGDVLKADLSQEPSEPREYSLSAQESLDLGVLAQPVDYVADSDDDAVWASPPIRERAVATTYAAPKRAIVLLGGITTASLRAHAARFDVAIVNLSRSTSASTNASYVADMKQRNPSLKVGQYVAVNDVRSIYPDLLTAADTANWWLRTAAGAKIQYWRPDSFEINLTSWATKNAQSQTWSQWLGEKDASLFFQAIPGIDFAYTDTVHPVRKTADWRRVGSDQGWTDAAVQAETRLGYMQYWNQLKLKRPGLKVVANADLAWLASAEFKGKLDGVFLTGRMGQSWSVENWGGWAKMMSEYRAALANVSSDKFVIFHIYAAPTDYAAMRYGLASSMLEDGYFALWATSGSEAAPWYDEYSAAIGTPSEPPPTTAASNGIWLRRYTNGLVLVNPSTTSSATINVGAGYKRISGVQDPVVNNGATVSSVTLGARQGLLLLKSDETTSTTSSSSTSTPVITSPLLTTAVVGQYYSYQITASGGPIVNYFASQQSPTLGAGIAPGLTGNGSTGLIYGTPTTAGTYTIKIGANSASATGTALMTLAVAPTGSTVSDAGSTTCKYQLPAGDTGIFKPTPKSDESTNTTVKEVWAAAGTGVGDIVFIGDSITGAWKFQTTLWNGLSTRSKVNLAVGGDTVQTSAYRLESGILNTLNPKTVVLMIGANNITTGGPSATMLGNAIWNLAALVKCQKPSAQIILMGTLPRGVVGTPDPTVDPILIQKVLGSNTQLAVQAAANPSIARLLDISSDYMIGSSLNQTMYIDQVHINNAGYQKWSDRLRPLLPP